MHFWKVKEDDEDENESLSFSALQFDLKVREKRRCKESSRIQYSHCNLANCIYGALHFSQNKKENLGMGRGFFYGHLGSIYTTKV